MPETVEYEKFLSDESFVFTLIGNRGILAFCPEKVVLVKTETNDSEFILKTAPKDRVELGEIREREPPERFPEENVEEREVDTETEVVLYVKNQTIQGFVAEDVETVSKGWLQTVNGYIDEEM